MTTADKKTKAYAKSLMKLCWQDGEFSDERALAVLQSVEKNPPPRYAAFLKAFLALVQRAVADRTAVVEHAGSLSDEALQATGKKLSQRYGRAIEVQSRQNDALIAGVRVRVGCDVYDSSIAASLAELEASLS